MVAHNKVKIASRGSKQQAPAHALLLQSCRSPVLACCYDSVISYCGLTVSYGHPVCDLTQAVTIVHWLLRRAFCMPISVLAWWLLYSHHKYSTTFQPNLQWLQHLWLYNMTEFTQSGLLLPIRTCCFPARLHYH
eukprot:GHRR01016853.1.p1 GENE.GHRR01016853.1~~GHRR01016853.1.p1  ORF type:complete len:134 (-),score=11.42 GHRR01016853.1:1082-1483(-)